MAKRSKRKCSIRGCQHPRYGANYCRSHLGKANNGTLNEPTGPGRPKKTTKTPPKRCGIAGCEGVVIARLLCEKHYQRWRRAGGIRLQPNFRCEPIPRESDQRRSR